MPLLLPCPKLACSRSPRRRRIRISPSQGKLKSDKTLIDEGKITDPEFISDYYKKQDTIKELRETYCFKKAHADECANDKAFKDKGDVNEALEWLRFHKEKDFNEAAEIRKKKEAGEEYKIVEKEDEGKGSDDDDD